MIMMKRGYEDEKKGVDKESNPGHRRAGHECEPQDHAACVHL